MSMDDNTFPDHDLTVPDLDGTVPEHDPTVPFDVVAMVERTLGPGATIGPAVPQPHLDGVILPLTVRRIT